MGFEDRSWNQSGGGGRGYWGRVFGNGENPFSWAFPLFSLWRIGVKIHVFFVVYLVIELIQAISRGSMGISFQIPMLVMLFAFVTMHEFGHCLACRYRKGQADEIILWPLGGLAMCRPRHDWLSHLITTLGGPAVNAVLIPVFGAVMLVLTRDASILLVHPFMPSWPTLELAGGGSPLWLWWIYGAYVVNVALLAFNMLVPMYPMDAGRTLQNLLWPRMGYEKSMYVATTVGLVTAGVLGVIAISTGQTILLALGIFGGLTCWQERKRLQFSSGVDMSMPAMREPGPSKREMKKAEEKRRKAQEDEARLDAILEKIAREGMDSLSKKEKTFLNQASDQMKTRR